jgi:hypothetical protein
LNFLSLSAGNSSKWKNAGAGLAGWAEALCIPASASQCSGDTAARVCYMSSFISCSASTVKYDFGLDAISELTLSQSLFFLGESALTF